MKLIIALLDIFSSRCSQYMILFNGVRHPWRGQLPVEDARLSPPEKGVSNETDEVLLYEVERLIVW